MCGCDLLLRQKTISSCKCLGDWCAWPAPALAGWCCYLGVLPLRIARIACIARQPTLLTLPLASSSVAPFLAPPPPPSPRGGGIYPRGYTRGRAPPQPAASGPLPHRDSQGRQTAASMRLGGNQKAKPSRGEGRERTGGRAATEPQTRCWRGPKEADHGATEPRLCSPWLGGPHTPSSVKQFKN